MTMSGGDWSGSNGTGVSSGQTSVLGSAEGGNGIIASVDTGSQTITVSSSNRKWIESGAWNTATQTGNAGGGSYYLAGEDLSDQPVDPNSVVMTCSAFSGLNSTYGTTTWQITTENDTTFSSPVVNVTNTNEESYALESSLEGETVYLAKVKQTSTSGVESSFSTVNTFKTKAPFDPTGEVWSDYFSGPDYGLPYVASNLFNGILTDPPQQAGAAAIGPKSGGAQVYLTFTPPTPIRLDPSVSNNVKLYAAQYGGSNNTTGLLVNNTNVNNISTAALWTDIAEFNPTFGDDIGPDFWNLSMAGWYTGPALSGLYINGLLLVDSTQSTYYYDANTKQTLREARLRNIYGVDVFPNPDIGIHSLTSQPTKPLQVDLGNGPTYTAVEDYEPEYNSYTATVQTIQEVLTAKGISY